MRTCLRLAATFALALLPGFASADIKVQSLNLRQQTLGWEAVGRLDLGSQGFCTGVLIAPDLVLTAAHCLVSSKTGKRVAPDELVFRAALSDGHSVAERQGLRAVVHPDYQHDDDDGLRQLRSDIGVLQLAQPIPASEAPPFTVGRPVREGDQVSVLSYARGRTEALGWQRACDVRGRGRGVLLMSCDTDFGSSGAPVFSMESGTPRLVSLISRGLRQGLEQRVWGMEIAAPLAEVKSALTSGQGVWPVREVSARRIQAGDRNESTGALFLRP